jgi:hypothetical protein
MSGSLLCSTNKCRAGDYLSTGAAPEASAQGAVPNPNVLQEPGVQNIVMSRP